MEKITAYIGLLRADGTEPDKASGYERVCIGEVELDEMPLLLQNRQIVFSDVTAPGYGSITRIFVPDPRDTDADAKWIWPLPEPVNVHQGVVPVIHKGKLLMGVDVKARCIVQPAAQCSTGR